MRFLEKKDLVPLACPRKIHAVRAWQAFIVVVFCFVALLCSGAFALELQEEARQEETPVIVNGDKVEFFSELEKVVAEGNVVVEYGETTLTCDKIVVFTATKDGFAEGNVVLTDKTGTVQGERLEYNFQSQKGKITGADIDAAPYFCLSPQAEKLPEKFILHDADITTCNLDQPHYHIHASKVTIYPQDRIVARGVQFVVGESLPVIYLPFFVQDLKERRHGFSFQPGQSKEWGTYLLSAYRFYLSEELRGLLRFDYRENKGFAYGVDLEKFAGEFGMASLRYYGISEDLHGRGETEPIYKKDERYKIEYRHKWDIDPATQFVTEISDYSDENFLRDYFYRQHEIDPTPRSYMLLSHSYPNATASVLFEKRFNQFFTTTEKIPELKLETRKFELSDSDFYYENASSITGFTNRTRLSDADEDTVRADTFNQISYPFKLAFFHIEPSVGTRYSYYSKDMNGSEDLFRGIFYSGCSLLTKFYKVFDDVHFNKFGLEINKLRHIITPSLDYQFINEPTLPIERLTAFDSLDTISKLNQVTLSLENKLQTKRDDQSVDFLRFLLSSPYDFQLEGHGGRFGDISADLEMLPNSWLKFGADAAFDPRRKSFRNANFAVTYPFQDKKGSITTEYRYSAGGDDSELFIFVLERLLNPKWKFRSYHRMQFTATDGIIEEQEYSLVRDLHCWEIEFIANAKKDQGTSFYIAFRNKTFPDLGFDFSKHHQAPRNP